MTKTSLKFRAFLLFFLLFALVATLIIFALISSQQSKASTNADASTSFEVRARNRLPTTTVSIGTGDFFTNGKSNALNIAELRYKFDPNKASLLGVTAGSNVLVLAQSVDNNQGTVQMDVAITNGDFSASQNLLEMQFSILSSGESSLSLTPESTLGLPNSLDFSRSKTKYTIASYK